VDNLNRQRDLTVRRLVEVSHLFENPSMSNHIVPNENRPKSELLAKLYRPRRQLALLAFGLGAGIAAIGSLLFSHQSMVGMSMSVGSAGASDKTIELLQSHEKRVTINEHSINQTKLALEGLARFVAENRAENWVLHEIFSVQHAFDGLIRQVNELIDGMESVAKMKMSLTLVPPISFRSVVARLRHRLALKRLLTLPVQGHEFYQLDTSFLFFTNRTLRVFIHVPAYYAGSLLDLYKFLPGPIRIGEERFLIPKPEAQILAIGSHSSTQFRAISEVDLASCKELGRRYYCPGQNFMARDVDHSCLFNLFHNRQHEMVELCQFSVMPPGKDYLVQLDPSNFLLYQATPGIVTIRCPHHRGTSVTPFSGLRRINLRPGCKAMSTQFTFYGELNIHLTDESLQPVIQVATNLTKYLPKDISGPEFDSVITQIQQIGTTKGVKIRDVATELRNERRQHWINLALSVGCGVVLLILLAIILYYCCRAEGWLYPGKLFLPRQKIEEHGMSARGSVASGLLGNGRDGESEL
jgi:hypothetical protein